MSPPARPSAPAAPRLMTTHRQWSPSLSRARSASSSPVIAAASASFANSTSASASTSASDRERGPLGAAPRVERDRHPAAAGDRLELGRLVRVRVQVPSVDPRRDDLQRTRPELRVVPVGGSPVRDEAPVAVEVERHGDPRAAVGPQPRGSRWGGPRHRTRRESCGSTRRCRRWRRRRPAARCRFAAAGVLNDVPAHTPRPSDSMSLPSAGHSCSPENMTSTEGRPTTNRSNGALIRRPRPRGRR